MVTIEDIMGLDPRLVFSDRDMDSCVVGAPIGGSALHLGYDGWGEPDIALDPAAPLDVCISRLGLTGSFKSVRSVGLLNRIHGDCMIAHAAMGLEGLMAENGELHISALSTAALAADALSSLNAGSFKRCQQLEKFCFRQADDVSGLMYQQTFLNEDRILSLFPSLVADVVKRAEKTQISGPESIRLDGVSDETWSRGEKNNGIASGLDHDWPNCILCRRLATKMDHNRMFYSRYCKDHYHEARGICDRRIIDSYMMEFVFRRR